MGSSDVIVNENEAWNGIRESQTQQIFNKEEEPNWHNHGMDNKLNQQQHDCQSQLQWQELH